MSKSVALKVIDPVYMNDTECCPVPLELRGNLVSTLFDPIKRLWHFILLSSQLMGVFWRDESKAGSVASIDVRCVPRLPVRSKILCNGLL